MITKKQLKILSVFFENLFREYSFKEIKKLSKEKSNSIIQNSIKAFLSEELIIERKIGTSKLYLLNNKNEKIYSYFDIFTQENSLIDKLLKKSINIIKEELSKYTYFYSLVVFGSYSKGEQKNNSDFDIAVFIENEDKRKVIKSALNSAELKSIIKLDAHVITKDEFLEMLKVDYENLGKEIARKHLVIYNQRIFYSILREGINHGFKL
jgi:predicted nucleotidyltransferase